MTAKRSEGLSPATLRKLKYQLGTFEQFLAARSKFFPSEITATDVIEFRSGWTWKSGVTRQKAQQNLRGFLRLCCTDNLEKLLNALKPIKLSKIDMTRLKPQPFSEEELKRLLAQVPKTFPDATKAAKMTALIHCQVSTGLAIRDTIQLERENLRDGTLRIERQKTNKPVVQKLDNGLHQELLKVTNGNPKYVFWNGTSLPTSATGLWQADLRQVMKDAKLWIKGNLSHRFRDTAVDFWLEQGCDMGRNHHRTQSQDESVNPLAFHQKFSCSSVLLLCCVFAALRGMRSFYLPRLGGKSFNSFWATLLSLSWFFSGFLLGSIACGCSVLGCSLNKSTTLMNRIFKSGNRSRSSAVAANASWVGISPAAAKTTSGS